MTKTNHHCCSVSLTIGCGEAQNFPLNEQEELCILVRAKKPPPTLNESEDKWLDHQFLSDGPL